MNAPSAEVIRTFAISLTPGCFALYLTANVLVRSFTDIWMFIGWTALCTGVMLTRTSIGPKPIFLGLLLLLIFHTLAIPGSILWGSGNWELTAGVVLWMAPGLLLYLANDVERVFAWLVPVFFVHAALIIVEGFTNWAWVGDVLVRQGTNTGLTNNPNLAAGFLTIGIIYLISTSKWWLSLPLLMALLFTGSQWGLVVAAVLFVAMVITGAISWRPLAGAVATMILAVAVLGLLPGGAYQVAGYSSFAGVINVVPTDIGTRLAVPHIPSVLPSGVAEHPGLHNVPLRIAVENGILAAGIWVLITGWALLKWKNGAVWWALLALVLLSLLDYYTWMGHLGGFWWLLIGLLTKPPRPSGLSQHGASDPVQIGGPLAENKFEPR